jgi:hypothetical protein
MTTAIAVDLLLNSKLSYGNEKAILWLANLPEMLHFNWF